MKVAFLDRDGTIIEDYDDQAWSSVAKPVFLPKAIEGIKRIRDKGFEIIIITNQYLIGENIITIEQYNQITGLMIEELTNNDIQLLDIFHCPHSREISCSCRKPSTGMIDEALRKYPAINLHSSFLVGDSRVDIEVGNKIGLKTFSLSAQPKGLAYITARNLLEVAEMLE